MILAVPAEIPIIMPLDVPMLTGPELLHAPPVTELLNVDAAPTHTDPDPTIGAGRASTVTVRNTMQPVGTV